MIVRISLRGDQHQFDWEWDKMLEQLEPTDIMVAVDQETADLLNGLCLVAGKNVTFTTVRPTSGTWHLTRILRQ